MPITATSGLGLFFPFSKTPGGTYSCRALTSLINLITAIITYQRRKQWQCCSVWVSTPLRPGGLLALSPNPTPTHVFFFLIPSPQVVLAIKSLPANAIDVRDTGSIPGSSRSPGGGHANPLQYSCLENPMDRGAWQATVHRVTESDMTEMT